MTIRKIKTLDISFHHNSIPAVSEIVEEIYEPPVLRAKPKPDVKPRFGAHAVWIPLFIENEISAMTVKLGGRDDNWLRLQFCSRMKKIDSKRAYYVRKQITINKITVGTFRNAYNTQKLSKTQDPIWLLSMRYNERGVPIKNMYEYLHWEDMYQKCLDLKIADPRFITPEEIEALRTAINNEDNNFLSWVVPSAKEIESLTNKIGKEVYNSVYFPCGWAREDST